MRTRLSVLAAVTLSVLALAGCEKSAVQGSPQPAGAATGNAATGAATGQQPKDNNSSSSDPKALISNAAKTTKSENSYKLEAKFDIKGQGELGLGGWTGKGEFDVKNNRSKLDAVMDLAGQKMTISIVTDGNTMYMRTAADGMPTPKWSKTDLKQLEASLGQLGGGAKTGGQNPGSDPMMIIDKIKEIASVAPDGSETIRGVPTTRYKVTFDPAKIPAEDKETGLIPADPGVSTALFVDGKGRLARFQISIAGENSSINWDFYDYGAPVKVDPPAPGEVEGG